MSWRFILLLLLFVSFKMCTVVCVTNNCNIITSVTPPACYNSSKCKICEHDSCEIRAAVILPSNKTSITSQESVVPMLKQAIEYAYEFNIIPRWLKVILVPKDDKCQASYAQLATIESYAEQKCIHVFFGPTCDYCVASVSRLIKFFNTPLLTTGGFSGDFQKQKINCDDEYFMLVRTGKLVFEGLSTFFLKLFKSYNWRKVAFLYDNNGQKEVAGENTCSLMMQSLAVKLKQIAGFQYKDGNLDLSTFQIDEFLKKDIGNNNGIVVMCLDRDRVREVLLAAEELDSMVYQGEYLFFNIELINKADRPEEPWIFANDTDEFRARLHNAYKSVFTITSLSEEVHDNDSGTYEIRSKSDYASGFYDAMLLYLHIVDTYLDRSDLFANANKTINGAELVKKMYGYSFQGTYGTVEMDCNGDRKSNYSLLGYNPDGQKFEVIAYYAPDVDHLTFHQGKKIHWPSGLSEAPSDTPECGFDHSKCANYVPYVIATISLLILVIIIGYFVYRYRKRSRLEADILKMRWKINWKDVELKSLAPNQPNPTCVAEIADKYLVKIKYKNTRVTIRKLLAGHFECSREQLIRFKLMQDIEHDHLVKFYGACLDSPNNCLVVEYCQKRSLNYILNKDITINQMTKLSLVQDLIKGMAYLHQSEIKSHGSLSSDSCVVDGRFALKITDFGLTFLPRIDDDYNTQIYKKLWEAPELLKDSDPPKEGTQKGDVYSCGIIMHEIYFREGPFNIRKYPQLKLEDIVNKISCYSKSSLREPMRPYIAETLRDDEAVYLMKNCWEEHADNRPDSCILKNTIRRLNKDDTGNILDNLLARLEQYANNLENLVEQRTTDFVQEKNKCELLLYQLLPKSVASQLINGQQVNAETYDDVTIYFSDIVGFTRLSADSTPLEIVTFLNDLYTCFDAIIEDRNVYKVETIGDAYMVVSGLPIRNGKEHAPEIASMALAILEAVQHFQIAHRPNYKLQVRIGIHSGTCVAGCVGVKMPRYCLFGDTVNTASRMESSGAPLRIHVSCTTKQILDEYPCFELEYRGEVDIKGKGSMITYWLVDKTNKITTRPLANTTFTSCSGGNIANALSTLSVSAMNTKLNVSETTIDITSTGGCLYNTLIKQMDDISMTYLNKLYEDPVLDDDDDSERERLLPLTNKRHS